MDNTRQQGVMIVIDYLMLPRCHCVFDCLCSHAVLDLSGRETTASHHAVDAHAWWGSHVPHLIHQAVERRCTQQCSLHKGGFGTSCGLFCRPVQHITGRCRMNYCIEA